MTDRRSDLEVHVQQDMIMSNYDPDWPDDVEEFWAKKLEERQPDHHFIHEYTMEHRLSGRDLPWWWHRGGDTR